MPPPAVVEYYRAVPEVVEYYSVSSGKWMSCIITGVWPDGGVILHYPDGEILKIHADPRNVRRVTTNTTWESATPPVLEQSYQAYRTLLHSSKIHTQEQVWEGGGWLCVDLTSGGNFYLGIRGRVRDGRSSCI